MGKCLIFYRKDDIFHDRINFSVANAANVITQNMEAQTYRPPSSFNSLSSLPRVARSLPQTNRERRLVRNELIERNASPPDRNSPTHDDDDENDIPNLDEWLHRIRFHSTRWNIHNFKFVRVWIIKTYFHFIHFECWILIGQIETDVPFEQVKHSKWRDCPHQSMLCTLNQWKQSNQVSIYSTVLAFTRQAKRIFIGCWTWPSDTQSIAWFESL